MIWEILTAVFYLAVVYLLVRPGSLASQVIADAGNAMAHLVTYAVTG